MQSIAIIGAGESGVGAAILAKSKGLDVFVSEYGTISEAYRTELLQENILFEEGGHDFERLLKCDVVIKSPGVPDTAPIIKAFIENKIPVISEIEFGHRFYAGMTLAVTGSNGKTTTSGLLYHMLKSAGKDVALGGNYGKSYARILAEGSPDVMVLEVSSFQLDNIDTFRPNIGILLNITPDHLDRYQYNIDNYADAKMRLGINQYPTDTFIYNGDDKMVEMAMSRHSLQSKMIPIVESDFIHGIPSKDGGEIFEISIKGKHNLFNAKCCVEACRKVGLSEDEMAYGLKTFVNLPHRLESCGEVEGVEFINDSKATNVDSVFYALDAMQKSVVWIAGGTDKGNDYSVLYPLVKNKVKALICLGVDNAKLKDSFESIIPTIIETTKVSEAVESGLALADSGDVVLLSPACASFDLFKNYIDRGDQFKIEVSKLSNKN